MNLATRVYRLTPSEIERFDCIYRSPWRDRLFRGEAKIWRRDWRRELKTDKRCRWFYLTSICADPLKPGTPMREIGSLALYLCWRVETEVRRMDEREATKSK